MEPDLSRDAAALFRHLRHLGRDTSSELTRWVFMFEAGEIEPLEALGTFFDSRLREFFHVLLEERTIVMDANGEETEGPPLLRLEFVGVIDEPMLAGMHKRLQELAAEYRVSYQGVSTQAEFPFDIYMFEAALSDDPNGALMSDEDES